jgi:hypothetical protein
VIARERRADAETPLHPQYAATMLRSNSFSSRLALSALICALTGATGLSLTACGTSARARTGFIPSNVRLTESDDLTQSWRASTFDRSQYSQVVIAPVAMPEPDEYGNLDADQLRICREALEEALRNDFAKPFGTGSGGRTLVVRTAITAIKPNKPLLNVAPQSQIMKRGYGYASCEIYATNGDGGPVVAAFMQTSDTSRFSEEKLSETGTARRAAGDWAKEFLGLLTR